MIFTIFKSNLNTINQIDKYLIKDCIFQRAPKTWLLIQRNKNNEEPDNFFFKLEKKS